MENEVKAIFSIALILFLIVGIFIGMEIGGKEAELENLEIIENSKQSQEKIIKPTFVEKNITSSLTKLKLLAVNQEGKGVTANLEVSARKGSGLTLVNIEKLFFWIDTQQSIRTARKVVEDYLDIPSDELDLTYKIDTNASIVGGPSAGAALTAATVSAVLNQSLNNETLITGNIQENGKIGKVGGIIEKVKAAKQSGYSRVLVPEGQSKLIHYQKNESCVQRGTLTICSAEYEPVEINIGKKLGMEVEEVRNVKEVLRYFGVKLPENFNSTSII